MKQALETVKSAISADRAGEFEKALGLYTRAIQAFLHEIKYERNEGRKRVLTTRVASYVDRAEQIKAALNTGAKPNRAVHGGSKPDGKAAGAASAPAAAAAAAAELEDDSDFDLKAELADRVGLASVKEQMLQLEHQLALDKRRREVNPKLPPTKFPHLLFKGPPGCGKTSMARLIARALRKLGILEIGHLVEVQRADLVAGHIGQTALKTKAVIESAQGGVLFVDECYRLSTGGNNDFGPEAVHEIMSAMERGDPCMIFAGYDDEDMDRFIETNPGLYRRIHQVFVFPSFTIDELAQILLIKIKKSGYFLMPPLKDNPQALALLLETHTTPLQRERMNGGLCDHVLRNAKRHLDSRLAVDAPVEVLLSYSTEDLVLACRDVPVPPGADKAEHGADARRTGDSGEGRFRSTAGSSSRPSAQHHQEAGGLMSAAS